MNDHNLDDLIIDNIEPKNTKSFLTIIALFIVVLIVAIILTKIILKDPDKEQLAFEENPAEMISPELTLQSATVPEPIREETKLSAIIENEPNTPVQAKKVTKKTEEAAKKVVQVHRKPKIETKKVTKKPEETAKKVVQVHQEPKVEPKLKAKTEPKVEPKVEPKIEPKLKAKIKSTIKPKITKKPEKQSVKAQAIAKNSISPAFYIQVGSFTKIPSAHFLSIIKNSGFNYKITAPTVHGIKKLLIGPYKDRKSINRALIRVKDRINKSAFVIKK